MSKPQYIAYKTSLTPLARRNRKIEIMTKAERLVWYLILNKKRTGFKFIRQKPIGVFILDYYCSQLQLGIEIDGNSHNNNAECDFKRQNYLEGLGIKIIRIPNDQVLANTEGICCQICEQLKIRAMELRVDDHG